MKSPWFLLYNFLLYPLLILLVYFTSLINNKIREGIKGRKRLFTALEKKIAAFESHQPRIWLHVSSLGEFEQAKPLIEKIKEQLPELKVIVTFFSPSGYRHSLHYKYADLISYLPFDSRRAAVRFLKLIKPSAAIFVRYDIWPNHIWAAAEEKIPLLLVNATMQPTSKRFYPLLKGFHKFLLNHLDYILTVSENDAQQFKRFDLRKPAVEIAGDTRYDRVWSRSTVARELHLIPENILKRKKVFVVGSSWQADEEQIIPVIMQLLKVEKNLITLLVPHEPTIHNLERIERELNGKAKYIRFSHLNNYNGEKIVIVDSVGVLLPLYQYAHIAYVGGGFKHGVHNVLEAAVYGIPVVYGPKHTNSQEAIELAHRKGGFVIKNNRSLYRTLRRLLQDPNRRKTAGKISREIVEQNIGATERIITYLQKHL